MLEHTKRNLIYISISIVGMVIGYLGMYYDIWKDNIKGALFPTIFLYSGVIVFIHLYLMVTRER